jgi:integrase
MGVKIRFWKGAWWVFLNHQGKRKAKRIGDKETAFKVAARIRERMAAGALNLPTATDDESFAVFARAWLKGLAGNLKASTIAFYTDNVDRYLIPVLGTRRLRDITRADCREVVGAARGKGLKLNTVKGIARTLSSMLSQAVEDEKLPANPALRMGRHLRRGDEPKTVIQPLTRGEAAHLVTTARDHFPRWHPWALCALRTGMRHGELLALQWGDIDWQGRFLLVQRNLVRGVLTSPKSHQRRRVDMSAQLFETLLAWRRLQRKRWIKKGKPMPPWVFASLEGTALEERNVRHVFTRILQRAELRQIRIHDLRHTFASLLLQQGESIVYVKEQLGHASIQITVDTYGAPDPGRESRGRRQAGRRAGATICNPRATGSGLSRSA